MNEKNYMLITPNSGNLLSSSMLFFYSNARATTLAMGPQNTEEPLGLPLYSIKGVHRHAPSLSKHLQMTTDLSLTYLPLPTYLPTNLLICFYSTNIPSMHTYFFHCNSRTQLVAHIKWK